MEKLELDEYVCLFDLDGTLLDSNAKIYQALSRTRNELRYPIIPVDQLFSQIGLPASNLFYDLNLNSESLNAAIVLFRKNLANIQFDKSDIFPGMSKVLEKLTEANCELMIATNKPKYLAEIALTGACISHFFSYISGGDYCPPKPDPYILNACVERTKRKKVVMIGDRIEDIQAALRMGADPISIAQGAHSKLELNQAGAKKVFLDGKEFLAALQSGWSFYDLQ